MSAGISTWEKAKDAALIGFVGLASLGLLKLMVDVADLKKDIAVYQARAEATERRVAQIEEWRTAHEREDRTFRVTR